MDHAIGQPVRRMEDAPLLTGHGRFADDITLSGQADMAVVRPPPAHASLCAHHHAPPRPVPRLYTLGIEPYLVGASLTAILAQRLVRQICPHCRADTDIPDRILDTLARRGITDITRLHKGRGCTRCRNTGFLGRIGIFELLVPDDDMRDMITAGAPLEKLRAKALELGMKPLFEDGLDKVRNAATTIEEVLRVTVEA